MQCVLHTIAYKNIF